MTEFAVDGIHIVRNPNGTCFFTFPKIEPEAPPKGKRRIHWNIYGNWVGYVSGRRWEEFGDHVWSEREAKEWLAKEELK